MCLERVCCRRGRASGLHVNWIGEVCIGDGVHKVDGQFYGDGREGERIYGSERVDGEKRFDDSLCVGGEDV